MNVVASLRAREKFLVLEIAKEGVHGLFFHIDEDHAIAIEKYVRDIDLAKFLARPWRRATQQAFEGEYLFKDHRRVIAVAESSMVTTMPIPVALVREPADVALPLTVPELENLIAQEMAKIFTACRTEAAARLGVHELDAVLVGEKADAFTIDGKAVTDPAGHTGKTIGLFIELTFTTRALFETLTPFFNAPDEFYFAESPQARLLALARVRALPLALIAPPSVFVLEAAHGKDAYPVLYREPFAWNFDALRDPIREAFGVSDAVAEDLYAAYVNGGCSAHTERIIGRMIAPAVDEFLAEAARRRLTGSIFFDTPYGVPVPEAHRRRAAAFEELPFQEVLDHAGFRGVTGAAAQALDRRTLSHYLFPFVEAYFDTRNTEINRKLRRRLHWLAS